MLALCYTKFYLKDILIIIFPNFKWNLRSFLCSFVFQNFYNILSVDGEHKKSHLAVFSSNESKWKAMTRKMIDDKLQCEFNWYFTALEKVIGILKLVLLIVVKYL